MNRPYSARDIRSWRAAASFFLTAPGPVTLLLFAVIMGACSILVRRWTPLDFLFALFVVAGWELLEQFIHRYFMHAAPFPGTGMVIRSPLHSSHQEHHRDPDALATVLFGPVNALLAVVAVSGVAALLLRDLAAFFGFSMLLSLMLVRYDWFHLLAHSEVVPASAWMRRVLEAHRQHHNGQGASHFSVSGFIGAGMARRERGDGR